MPTPAEIRAELERRKRAASAPVQAPAPVAPVSNADAIRAELARRKAAAPAPMSQPDASPWGNGQAFDDMYARKPQTDPMLSPLRPEARTLTSGAPTQMKPPPAPRGPVMSPFQRQAMAPERAAAEAERRAAQERREAAAAFGGGMDMLPTMDAGGNVRPGTDVDRDIGAGITGTVSGIRPLNALSNTVEAAVNLPGDALQSVMGGERVIPRADIPSVPLPKQLESVTGDLSQGIMQFLMARGVIGKAAPGGGMAAQAGKDAAAIFAGFDSDTPRMAETLAAEFMRENGMGWMADRDPNNPLMERVKNGIEEMFLAYAPVEVARRTPQVVDAITGVGRLPNRPTNAGGANLAPAAPPVAPMAPTVAATQTAPQAPTQPQTATAPPVPPIPPNAPAATVATPQPVPVTGAAPPAGQLTPVSSLGPAEQAFNNLPMKTRESMLNAFQSAGIEPNRAKAMIGELNNLPDGQNTMYALEVMRRNGLSDADIDGVLIAMGREFATESPRPAGRVFNREQDSARQIMNDQVRTQINSEGRSITDVAERNFGEGVVPAGEALDLELDQLSNAYETILSTKRSPTGRLRSPAKKDAVYKAREDLTNALVSPEVMQTIPQDVKLQIMMQASDDMRRLKFTPDELGLILQGDGKVLAPLFNGYGALSWSPDLWAHLARQYPTQAAHSLQSALRKAADEAFRRGDATAGRYYKRLRGESGKGGLLDTLERAVPKYKETRVQFGDASSAKEALDILERFKAAAASEGDVAKIIKDLEVLPQRHREMAEQQITSIIRQELARKVESPRLAELGQTVAQTPNLTSLSRQDFLKALEDVFGPRGKELADAIRAARARTDTLTSISPKYNSRTEVNRQDVQNAPALYEAPGSLEGGIIDAGVKRLGTVAGGASLIPGGQGAALALGAATAVQAAMNAARRGKRLSNAERNALVDFLFKSRTANDAAPPVATRGPSMGDYAQAIGRDAVIGAGVGAVADGDPLNNDPMALIGGAVGGATGYGRARIRNARSLIKPPPAPRGAGSRNPPPAGPGVGGPNAPRPLPGQTSNSAPAVTGALVGGAAGYAAAPEDQKGLGLVAGIAGGGVLANRLAKGSTPKAPPAVKAKPAFDQRFMKEAQRLVSYNGGVDKALKAQQYVIDQLKNSKAPNAEDRLNRAVSIQYAIRRMAERSNRELDEIVPIAEAAPTGPKPIDPNTNYNIDPRGDKFVIRTDAGEEVLGAPQFSDRKQALAWLQGETRKARQGGAAPMPRSGPPGVKPPPVKMGIADNLKQDAGIAALGSVGGSFANQDDPQAGALGGMGLALGGKYVPRAVNAVRGAGRVKPPPVRGADQAGIKAYHGSPHDFDKFDSSKIGTGEGAQSYGRGLYFAENEGVARSYRDALKLDKRVNSATDRFQNLTIDGEPLGKVFNIDTSYVDELKTLINAGDTAGVKNFLTEKGARWKDLVNDPEYQFRDYAAEKVKAYDGLLSRLDQGGKLGDKGAGRLYEVDINADPEDFLDWDKPLSAQSPKVQASVRKVLDGQYGKGTFDEFVRANDGNNEYLDILENFDEFDKDRLSASLREAGIPGIKYLDQGSRGAGDGTRNYVVFDDSAVNIINKQGFGGGGPSRPTPPKGQKAPPKGPSFPPRLAADLNKSKVSPATRATLDQNAALPPGERKSVMEATGWSDDILRIAAPYIRPGTRMESEVGNRIARLVQQANANPVEYALRQTMAKGAYEEAQKRFKQASGARSRAANNLENLRRRNMLNPNQPATQQQLTVHKQRRDDAEQFLSEAARLRDEAKVMLDRADVELMSLPQVRDFANKEIQRITDALGVGGKASPGTAQLPSYNPMVKGPKPIPKPGAVNRPSKQAADELAHLLFEQDMAEKFAKIQSGEITPTQRNTFQQVMSWYARHPSLAAVSVAAAGGSAVGYAALATDQGERAVQARENARKRSGQPEPELPGPPAWDWEKLSRNPRFAGDTQAALQALGYKIGKIDNNIRRADGKRTESEKALYHFLWTLDNTRDPEAPPTEAEWDALKEAALQARRRR